MNISEKIKKYRKAKNMTQEKLAQQLNISFQSVSKWENGQSEPDLETFAKLAKILGVSTDELLNVNNQVSPEKFFTEILKEKYDYNRLYSKIDDFIRGYLVLDVGDPIWEIDAGRFIKGIILSLVYKKQEVSIKAIKNVMLLNDLLLSQEERQQKIKEYFLTLPEEFYQDAVCMVTAPTNTFRAYMGVCMIILDRIQKDI